MPKYRTKFGKWYKQLKEDLFEAAFDQDYITIDSLEELAEKADLCNATVYNLFNNITQSPRLETMYKIASALGLKWDVERPVVRKRSNLRVVG